MSNRIRIWKPHIVFAGVSRTVDRVFAFKPNHHRKNRLISQDTPLNALDPRNDILPKPSVINIIGSAFARAQSLTPIQIHWLEGNINHNHFGFSADKDHVANISPFFRNAFSNISRQINKLWEREGTLITSHFRIEDCLDDPSAEKQLFYALTNPTKDGLIESTAQSPFISTYKHQAHGDELKFWRIDYAGYWAAGGTANKKLLLIPSL